MAYFDITEAKHLIIPYCSLVKPIKSHSFVELIELNSFGIRD